MKHTLLGLAATISLAAGLNAEYPRDAADRFKMKFGIEHPVVRQEAQEKLAANNRTRGGKDFKFSDKTGQDSASAENCSSAPCKVTPPVSR